MKRTVCFQIAIVLLIFAVIGIPSAAIASAPAENVFSPVSDNDSIDASQNDSPFVLQSEIIFNPVKDAASDRDLGVMRLREAGCSEFTIGCFSDEELELLSTAKKVIITTAYFAEVCDESSGESNMVNISYEDFLQLEQQDIIEEEELPVLISSDDSSEQGMVSSPAVQKKMNGGLLRATSRFIQTDSQSGYCMSSDFVWVKMPSYRSTDVFAITRDSGTVEVPNFSGRIQYIEKRRTYYSFGGGISVSPEKTYLHTKSLANDDSSNTGFGIRFNVPSNILPPSHMFPNQVFRSRKYYNLSGHIHYYGYLRYPSLIPQYFNHWTTYLHRKGYVVNLGASFSVQYPYGAAISIEPRFAPKFDKLSYTLTTRYGQ